MQYTDETLMNLLIFILKSVVLLRTLFANHSWQKIEVAAIVVELFQKILPEHMETVPVHGNPSRPAAFSVFKNVYNFKKVLQIWTLKTYVP